VARWHHGEPRRDEELGGTGADQLRAGGLTQGTGGARGGPQRPARVVRASLIAYRTGRQLPLNTLHAFQCTVGSLRPAMWSGVATGSGCCFRTGGGRTGSAGNAHAGWSAPSGERRLAEPDGTEHEAWTSAGLLCSLQPVWQVDFGETTSRRGCVRRLLAISPHGHIQGLGAAVNSRPRRETRVRCSSPP
jgi:hypothetical protein